ncbi:hypothetical protein TOPH_07452, partial [Tolypocladium ophioglossoides CBS 100239]
CSGWLVDLTKLSIHSTLRRPNGHCCFVPSPWYLACTHLQRTPETMPIQSGSPFSHHVHPHMSTFIEFALPRPYIFLSEYLHHGQSAWLSALTLTLAEHIALVQLANMFHRLIDSSQTDAFDAVLLKYSLHDIVSTAQKIKLDMPNVVEELSTHKPGYTFTEQPWSLFQLLDMLVFVLLKWHILFNAVGYQIAIYLPPLLLPYLGVPLFFMLCGCRLRRFLWNRILTRFNLEDTCFGMVALALELITPVTYGLARY